MNSFDVQLLIHPNSKVTVIDDFAFLDWPGHYGTLLENLANYVSIEFTTDKDDKIEDETVVLTEYCHYRDNLMDNTEFPLFNDGIHYYYKIMIPHLTHLFVEDAEASEVHGHTMYNYLFLKDETFYYKGRFYKYNGESIPLTEPMRKEFILKEYIQTILKNSTEYVDYIELYKNLGSQSFSCKKMLFTICKLTQCFVNLQRNAIDSQVYNKCNTDDKLIENRDFILCSLYVLDYLKDIGQYQEAQRILENITECNGLCKQSVNTSSCGCNG